ncbi:MAG: MopE-related protein [bacterium]
MGRGAACMVGRGACAAFGVWVCLDDVGVCFGEALPAAPEGCNGVDDDCDGRVDEGLGLGEGCAVGVGACRAEGVVGCVDGLAACGAAAAMPGVEVCDGVG